MTEAFPHMDAVFFSLYKLPKTLPVTMLFSPVLLVLWIISLWRALAQKLGLHYISTFIIFNILAECGRAK